MYIHFHDPVLKYEFSLCFLINSYLHWNLSKKRSSYHKEPLLLVALKINQIKLQGKIGIVVCLLVML